jgi:hypothetical protein
MFGSEQAARAAVHHSTRRATTAELLDVGQLPGLSQRCLERVSRAGRLAFAPGPQPTSSASRRIKAQSDSRCGRSVGIAPMETRTIQRPATIAGVR